MQKGQVTELPSHPSLYPFFPKEALQGIMALLGSWFEMGNFNLQSSDGLDLNKTFPDIHPTSVHQIITEAWE